MWTAEHILNRSIQKTTCQADVMLSSKKIKPIALAVVKLCLSVGISYSISQLACKLLSQLY